MRNRGKACLAQSKSLHIARGNDGVGYAAEQPYENNGQHHANQAVPNQQHQQRAEIKEGTERDSDQIGEAKASPGGKHTTTRGVQHQQRRAGVSPLKRMDCLPLQGRRYSQGVHHRPRRGNTKLNHKRWPKLKART